MPDIQGIAYPLEIKNGSLVLATDIDLLKTHILSVLETENFERVMRPEYGTPDFLFNSVQDIYAIAQFVRQTLEAQIPEANFEVQGALGDGGLGILSVIWDVDGQLQAPLQFALT